MRRDEGELTYDEIHDLDPLLVDVESSLVVPLPLLQSESAPLQPEYITTII